MEHLKSVLTQSVPRTPIKLWHFIALLTVVWILPIFLPSTFMQNYIIAIIVAWTFLYLLLGRTLKLVMRTTPTDAVLIERYFILLSFVVPFIYGILYGLRTTFSGVIVTLLVIDLLIITLLIVGIIIHIKSASKFYHGIKKDELFK